MKLFSCPACSKVVFFENVVCESCRHALGYDPSHDRMVALDVPATAGTEASPAASGREGQNLVYCANHTHGVCNWLVPEGSGETFCLACRHNVTVPDFSDAGKMALWHKMELAKHRMIYTALRLRLPLTTRAEAPEGLGFDFLSDDPQADGNVMTGHDRGLITIALVEADDAEREKRRTAMGEPYRTLLGHFRHEVGHWYWDRLVRDGGALAECRAVFGDDRRDYGDALKAHYANGPVDDWQQHYVSSYAGSHPWEDFAETFAHYFHIVDTLETGASHGVSIEPPMAGAELLMARLEGDVFAPSTTIGTIAANWHALSVTLNSFARSMGHGDSYPFVLAPAVVDKLGFVHDLLHGRIGETMNGKQNERAVA